MVVYWVVSNPSMKKGIKGFYYKKTKEGCGIPLLQPRRTYPIPKIVSVNVYLKLIYFRRVIIQILWHGNWILCLHLFNMFILFRLLQHVRSGSAPALLMGVLATRRPWTQFVATENFKVFKGFGTVCDSKN